MTKQTIAPLPRVSVLETLPPYPIVLVSTRTNTIAIGQLHYFTFAPLRLGIAVAHARHTHGLLRDEREFVVNIPGKDLLDAVRTCGSLSGRDGDKFAAAGLSREDSLVVAAASIAECSAHIEVQIEQELDFEERTWFIGPVVAARKTASHRGDEALLCGRRAYVLPGEDVGKR